MTDLQGTMPLRASSLSDPACQIISCSDTDTGASVQVDEAWHSVAREKKESLNCLLPCVWPGAHTV